MPDEATMSAPELTALSPDTASVNDGKLVLALIGDGFTMHSQVYYDGRPQPTAMLGQDLLSSPLDPVLFDPGTIEVTVKTGDNMTAALSFTLTGTKEETRNGEDDKND